MPPRNRTGARPGTNGKHPAPALSRWGTLNGFVAEHMARLTKTTGSVSAAALWFVLFQQADGKTGRVRGASVSRLSALTGTDRKTVRAALKALIDAEFLAVETPGAVPIYRLAHCEVDA